MVVAAVAGAVAHGPLRIAALGAVVAFAGAFWAMRRAGRTLVLDDTGYAVEAGGRERFRVAWSEVARVRHEPREHAVYVDCGDKTRNLFIPPPRGFGFRFSDAAAATARVLASVPPERIETVERIEAGLPAQAPRP